MTLFLLCVYISEIYRCVTSTSDVANVHQKRKTTPKRRQFYPFFLAVYMCVRAAVVVRLSLYGADKLEPSTSRLRALTAHFSR